MREFIKFIQDPINMFMGIVVSFLIAAIVIPIAVHISALSLKTGTVCLRRHESTSALYYWQSDGKGGGYLQTIIIPESWHIVIEGVDPKGKFKTRDISVSEDDYQTIKVGQTFTAQ